MTEARQSNQSDSCSRPTKRKRSKFSLLMCFIIVLALLIAWHVVAPLLGIAAGFSGIALAIVMATVAILCVAVVLSFVWFGLAIIGVIIFSLVWLILVVLLFPFLIPFLIPMVLIVLLIRALFR